ncbi:hypothetical protein [uncultured Clostridium sp.]|uniref:hypothetical protein n=1 Tax=uncultured Clostridium sp. TaxID=59620 RepID=UPI0025F442DF|nr:hypothetical protein [uncultured Clostridium sp.]
MESDYEIVELLNKLSAEMCSKFDGIHFEINSMKSAISTLNKKIEKNHLIIDKIDTTLDELLQIINSAPDNISNNSIPEINENINIVKGLISDSSEKFSEITSDSSSKLLLISQDLKFLTHKVLQSEKDLFNIQEEIRNNNINK